MNSKKEVRAQYINNKKGKKLPPIVEHERHVDPKATTIPIRAVLYVEVGDMASEQVSLLSAAIADQYKKADGGVHYIMPVRDGKLGPDIVFEEEFLKIVNKMCEIKNGAIVLKGGAQKVQIVKERL